MLIRKNKKLRLQGFDYSSPGWYYVTICTKDRIEWFGEIKKNKMILNASGQIVLNVWNQIPQHYQGISIDELVIMPNHLHGIIIIEPIRRNYNDFDFSWQKSFHDHIIRNEQSIYNIRKYIKENPLKGELDRNNFDSSYKETKKYLEGRND